MLMHMCFLCVFKRFKRFQARCVLLRQLQVSLAACGRRTQKLKRFCVFLFQIKLLREFANNILPVYYLSLRDEIF